MSRLALWAWWETGCRKHFLGLGAAQDLLLPEAEDKDTDEAGNWKLKATEGRGGL